MAAAHIDGGRDVIVPQYLATNDEVSAFQRAAQDNSGTFVEVLLVDSRASVIERFNGRRADGSDLRGVITRVVERAGGETHLQALYDELMAGAATRTVVEIRSEVDDVEGTYRQMTDRLTTLDPR